MAKGKKVSVTLRVGNSFVTSWGKFHKVGITEVVTDPEHIAYYEGNQRFSVTEMETPKKKKKAKKKTDGKKTAKRKAKKKE